MDFAFLMQETDDGARYIDWILSGLAWTVTVAIGALIIALLLGAVLGVMRTTTNKWLVHIGDFYVDLFRNIPLIVQLFLWFFVLPELVPKGIGDWMKQDLPPIIIAVLGLGFYTAARVSEQVRAGINALPRGQRNAGLAIGFTEWQTYRYVRLPMAFRIIIPTLTSEAMNIFKNSSVTFAVGILELYFQYKQIYEKTNDLAITVVITAIYFILAFSVNILMSWIEKRTAVPGFIAGDNK